MGYESDDADGQPLAHPVSTCSMFQKGLSVIQVDTSIMDGALFPRHPWGPCHEVVKGGREGAAGARL
jgi:hypothetical protein